MAWDEITLESPSFNATNAGTMMRLPASVWSRKVVDASAEPAPVGNNKEPVKSETGAFREIIDVVGQITTKTATDTAIWSPTIVEGVSRTALLSAEEFVHLIDKSKKTWWKEAGTGTWHNDGTPARAKGKCRMRLGSKETAAPAGPSSLAGYYLYGFVRSISWGPVESSHKDSKTFRFRIEFERGDVVSTG